MMLWSCSRFVGRGLAVCGPGLALGPRLFTNDPLLTKKLTTNNYISAAVLFGNGSRGR